MTFPRSTAGRCVSGCLCYFNFDFSNSILLPGSLSSPLPSQKLPVFPTIPYYQRLVCFSTYGHQVYGSLVGSLLGRLLSGVPGRNRLIQSYFQVPAQCTTLDPWASNCPVVNGVNNPGHPSWGGSSGSSCPAKPPSRAPRHGTAPATDHDIDTTRDAHGPTQRR